MGGIILEFIVFPNILNDYSFNSKFKKYIMYFAASNYLLSAYILLMIFLRLVYLLIVKLEITEM